MADFHIIFQKCGEEVGRQAIRQVEHEQLTLEARLLSEILTASSISIPSAVGMEKRGATPLRFSCTALISSLFLPDLLLQRRVDAF